jgi:hypothetical protein
MKQKAKKRKMKNFLKWRQKINKRGKKEEEIPYMKAEKGKK